MDGILDIQLVPRWSPSSVKWDLEAAVSRARCLQAGIAYWTISDTLFGPDLTRVLAADDGFVCVDLHAPTDVDALAALAARGAHVRVYHEEIRTYTVNGRREPPQLLHSKMLLFWSADRTVELWVGSHNWTHRALLGLNVEASLVVALNAVLQRTRASAGQRERPRAGARGLTFTGASGAYPGCAGCAQVRRVRAGAPGAATVFDDPLSTTSPDEERPVVQRRFVTPTSRRLSRSSPPLTHTRGVCDTAGMSDILTIRVPAGEKAEWERAAAAAQESVAEYVRKAVRDRARAGGRSGWDKHLGAADVDVEPATNVNVRRAFRNRRASKK